MRRTCLLTLSLLLACPVCRARADAPLLLQNPTVSQDQIVFTYAGDLWTVARTGGDAKRLTAGVGIESQPHFSPDGKSLAFTGQYDGNTDIFVMPANGGVPRRLTYHPSADQVVCWTPDGKNIVFMSSRDSSTPVPHLFTIGREGGSPQMLPLPSGVDASYSPDGKRLAYVPIAKWQKAWKRYQGGQTTPIWLAGLPDLKIEKVPRNNSNDEQPMWVGDKVYFLSDRNGAMTLFRYDTASKRVTQAVKNDGLDIKAASAGPGAIVYEQFGTLFLYDTAAGKGQKVDVRLTGDLPEVRPRYVNVGNRIANAALSPTGARAVFEARGEILTIPAEKGDPRNLTKTPGVMEREPAWSPDGKWIAYFSDESGEYQLHLRDQSGKGTVKKLKLGASPSFFYAPTWSPDSKKIVYTDKKLTLWYIDIEKGAPVKIDQTPYFNPTFQIRGDWSPDSRWVVYSRQLKSHLCALFVYSVESGKSTQITDGLSDAQFPAFDRGGKYIFFTASTDVGLTPGWLNMSSMGHAVTRSAYVVVLRKDLPSPLAPESDEEKISEPAKPTPNVPMPMIPKPDATKPDPAKPDAAKPTENKDSASGAPMPDKPDEKNNKDDSKNVRIDFDNIGQRILALPVPARNYVGLAAGKAGTVLLAESPLTGSLLGGGSAMTLHRFDLNTRKVEKMLDGVGSFVVSANGEKLLYQMGQNWAIAGTGGIVAPGAGTLKTAQMEVYCDPRAEWKQMYHEVWRIERDFFYAPNLHGLDVNAVEKKYAPYLEGIASRADLNYLFEEMLGELTCGHVFIGGGDQPSVNFVSVGLLGADYKVENGRYRFARIFNGENWNPGLRAPLTQPGVNVSVGDYLIAVNGRDVQPTQEVHAYFEATAGKQTVLTVSSKPDGSNSREVTVVPVGSESGLRTLAWVEDNRRKVDQLSGGRIAYVYLPDTAGGGYTNFNRYYFAQIGKEGAIIDERYNGGGLIADYVIDYLRRPLQGYFAARDGDDYITPVGSIYGTKVMLINEYAGSGGDMMPWLFRDAKLGTLIGKRTWGGLVGMAGAAALMDGGFTGAPQSGFWNPNGTWDVENHGVDPDIEVENDPASVQAGHDLQLERAVAVVMEGLKKNPPPKHKKPTYPDYQKGAAKTARSR